MSASGRACLFLQKWSGATHEQYHGHYHATVSIAKSFKKKYGPEVKWLIVYTDEEVLYEYIDDKYNEVLETLYFRSPNKLKEPSYYKNYLSILEKTNPALFEKYLDWFSEINKNKSK